MVLGSSWEHGAAVALGCWLGWAGGRDSQTVLGGLWGQALVRASGVLDGFHDLLLLQEAAQTQIRQLAALALVRCCLAARWVSKRVLGGSKR